eukprot:scpid76571/ scgid22514/ 
MSKRPPKRKACSQLSLDQFLSGRNDVPHDDAKAASEVGTSCSSSSSEEDGCDVQAVIVTPPSAAEVNACSSAEGESCSAAPAMCYNDVGKIVGNMLLPLSSENNARVIKEHFVPSLTYEFPKVDMNGRKRSFRH